MHRDRDREKVEIEREAWKERGKDMEKEDDPRAVRCVLRVRRNYCGWGEGLLSEPEL